MITLVRLKNWRAYRDVTLQLERGTTFIVALNGVGKSSLIEAVQWALDRTRKPTADPIRKGTRSAAVDVEIDAGGTRLRIMRSLDLGNGEKPKRTPKESTLTFADGEEISNDDFFDRLTRLWGADSGFVSRTAFLTDNLISNPAEPELRTHLCQAFALDRLHDAIDQMAPHIAAAGKDAETARSNERDTDNELQQAEQAVADAIAAVTRNQASADQLRTTDEAAAQALAAAQTAETQAHRLTAWTDERDRLRKDASKVVGKLSRDVSLLAVLHAAVSATDRQLDEVKEQRTRLSERLRTTEDALSRLLAAGGDCPICRRPLDDSSRQSAHDQHRHDQTETSAQLANIDVDETSATSHQLHALAARAERLGDPPPTPIATTIDVATAAAAASTARRELETALVEVGAAKSAHAAAVSALRDIQARITAAANVPDLYRRQGVLEAARNALSGTIDEVLHQQLGPIRNEVNQRWDAVFADRPGLRVDPDGRITRALDGEDLDFDSFSAGEKTVARLLFRLATLVTTTNVPFCWIDEPLEHLDPDSRRVVAKTLALLSKHEYLGQIIVTTYEEDLAISLSRSERDHVRLEYLKTTQVQV